MLFVPVTILLLSISIEVGLLDSLMIATTTSILKIYVVIE